jgi:hypothetical protein
MNFLSASGGLRWVPQKIYEFALRNTFSEFSIKNVDNKSNGLSRLDFLDAETKLGRILYGHYLFGVQKGYLPASSGRGGFG